MNKHVNFVSLSVQLAVPSVQQIIGVAIDSPQHESHNKIHGIDAFYDH